MSDKGTSHSYIDTYERLLAPYDGKPITLLEVGVKSGASIAMWSEHFSAPGTRIIGVDVVLDREYQVKGLRQMPGVELYDGSSTDKNTMARFADATIDVFIDDGSHLLKDQVRTLQVCQRLVKPGGIYIIEDIDVTDIKPVMNSLEELAPTGKLYDLRSERGGRHDNTLFVIQL